MDRDFTINALTTYLVKNKNGRAAVWAELIYEICRRNGIDTPDRLAMFMAQCCHESTYFTRLVENLNYSAAGLQTVFKKYFPTPALANQYARKPEQIANRVYASRMGNGPEYTGDGWKYKGRGIIQLTGRLNYVNASSEIYGNDSLIQNPSILETNEVVAVEVACWFWTKNNINRFADKQDVTGATRVINGGTNGLEDRQKKYRELKTLLTQ